MNTCPFHTVGCGLSVPCVRCRAVTSRYNRSISATGHPHVRRHATYWVGKSGR